MGRDLRVDFFRGMALLSILCTHLLEVAGTSIPRYLYLTTPAKWSISTPTDLFVFLAGYVYGLVYMRVYERHGLGAAYRRSVRRAGQLYAANIATLLIALGIVSVTTTQWRLDPSEVNSLLVLPASTPPSDVVWRVMSFRLFPYGFDILALYMVLLVVAPLFLRLMRKNATAALAASAGVYVAAQAGLTLPVSVTGVWFNPFAWQLLFVLGMYLSWKQPAVYAHPVLIGAVVCLLAASAIAMGQFHLYPRFSGKANMEPLRVLHFMTLVYVAVTVTRGRGEFWARAGVMPVVVTGQQSLAVFCFGLVFTFGGCALMHAVRGEWPFVVMVLLGGCMGSIGFAHVVQWTKRARRAKGQEHPVAVALK